MSSRIEVSRKFKVSSHGLTIEFDASQIIPDNPGDGTPVMVYGPNNSSSTYWCAADTGELCTGDNDVTLTDRQVKWLHSMEPTVDEFMETYRNG